MWHRTCLAVLLCAVLLVATSPSQHSHAQAVTPEEGLAEDIRQTSSRTYAGDCTATRIPRDIGKLCSSYIAERDGTLAYAVSLVAADGGSWVFLEDTGAGWVVVLRVPIDDSNPAQAVPWPPVERVPADQLADLLGGWGAHGRGMSIEKSGAAYLTWRVYRWCDDDPRFPCDAIIGNQIISGGHGTTFFTTIDDGGLHGVVLFSTDLRTLRTGATVTLQVDADGLGWFTQNGALVWPELALCRPDIPFETIRRLNFPCGA